jgi:mRNA interferase MazF
MPKRKGLQWSSVRQTTTQLAPDLILIAVTSQVRTPLLFGEVMITDWQAAGLLKLSVIKPVLTTIQKDLVIRQLGNLASSDRQSLNDLLLLLLTE